MPSKPSAPKTILITGCSSDGLGASLALLLANAPAKHHIFATARTPSKIPETLSSLTNVTALQLDVTSPASIQGAVAAVIDHGRGLDVLVNNAGIGYTIPLLDAQIEAAKSVYETNIWGALAMVQGFSDLLIASKGAVVNVGSVGAVVNTPWIGIYSSSKSALAQLSETLRLELAPLGVSVLCLMLGTVTTSFHANEPPVVLPEVSRYTAIRETISRWATGQAGPKGCSVEEAAVLIGDAVIGGASGLVWKGPNSGAVRLLAKWCPVGLLDSMMKNGQGLDELEKSRN
ncbi:hypothetical protein BJX76DRAFT_365781 [Aspergillus varians]